MEYERREMNRLRKKAINEMILVIICCIIMIAGFAIMTGTNAKGVEYVFITLITGSITGVVSYSILSKKEKLLDEMERAIRDTAAKYSYMVYVGYTLLFCFTSFFLVGGAGKIDVWVLPMMFAGGLLIAQIVQSMYILNKCSETEEDE